MSSTYNFLAWIFFLQIAIPNLASPLLNERGKSRHPKCTNAPGVVPGYYVDPKDAQLPNSASATCQAESQYLYCIPSTYTYISFGTLKPSLRPTTSYASALNSTIAFINQHIEVSGDGPITDGQQYITTSGTGVEIFAQDANNHHLTWGVLGVALQGLNVWMGVPDNGYSDATFQISDGKNEVGNGYIGALNEVGVCVFANAYEKNTACAAVDEKGFVYGPHGGTVC